jgi:hypothetical protein
LTSSVAFEVVGGSRKQRQMHRPSENETQLEVELDCWTIRFEHVQERGFPARHDGSDERTYKPSSEPLSSTGRMDAHGADFGEAIKPHALSGHGDQYPLLANADVLPEFNRAWAERPWMCGLREREHVRDISSIQASNRHGAHVSGHLNQDHLIDSATLDDREK